MLTHVTLTEEEAERTRVTVEWEPCREATPAEIDTFVTGRTGMTGGWTGSFDKLETALAADRREWNWVPPRLSSLSSDNVWSRSESRGSPEAHEARRGGVVSSWPAPGPSALVRGPRTTPEGRTRDHGRTRHKDPRTKNRTRHRFENRSNVCQGAIGRSAVGSRASSSSGPAAPSIGAAGTVDARTVEGRARDPSPTARSPSAHLL